MVQINNSFADACYFPYSVGLLQAYVKKNAAEPKQFIFLEPIYRRIKVEEAVSHLEDADIVGFSAYVWNFRLSLAIAEELKKRNPAILIVFGGPHVPEQAERFLRKHPFIDLACHGEGEKVFLGIAENYRARSWESVPSISRLEKAKYIRNQNPQRILKLSSIPSPYLEGVFDDLIRRHDGKEWLGLWETNRGCPFSCAYCDWGSASHTRLAIFDMERLVREAQWFANNRVEFIFCCDSNFGILPRDLEIVQLVADVAKQKGFPKAFSVQSTKNALERAYKVQKTLAEARLNKGVNIALQTIDETTLKNIGRQNVSLETFRELQRRFTRDGIETFTDIILGLPGESHESFVIGVDQIIENGQHNRIQFINLALLPNAPMADLNYQKTHDLIVVESEIINIHGSLSSNRDEISETQKLVIATKTMPKEDWVKARVFSWMTSLLHFDKILQIPFILLHEICRCTYRELVEVFLLHEGEEYPVTTEMVDFFRTEAQKIQNGGKEFYHSEEWLNIYWPHDEYMLMKLVVEDKLSFFYEEAEALIGERLRKKGVSVPFFLHEAIALNDALLKRPFQRADLTMNLTYNIFEFYKSVLMGAKIAFEQRPASYRVDRTSETWTSWEDWFREVIWYGNKKAAYLYSVQRQNENLQGTGTAL